MCPWFFFYKCSSSETYLSTANNLLFVWTICNRFLHGCIIFAVPFEEDDKDTSIWFLDHNYHEAMFSMFKRINGWHPILSVLMMLWLKLLRMICYVIL